MTDDPQRSDIAEIRSEIHRTVTSALSEPETSIALIKSARDKGEAVRKLREKFHCSNAAARAILQLRWEDVIKSDELG